MYDKEVSQAIAAEKERQNHNIELIASENFVSADVLAATGSILTNKYAEGYPGNRYYHGCENVDVIEDLARNRLCQIFQADHANVQAHSGSQANMAVYQALLKPNDIVLGMDLNAGGHLTHGHRLNFSGQLYDFHAYGVDPISEQLDYEAVRQIALEIKPKLIVAGASSYPRAIDFTKFREIADEVGAYLMVDMAHIAGLVAAGLHQNPVLVADVVTSTTHKTLRGPRGGIILCKKQYAAQIDQAIFPGIQGGPLMHIIAAKAVSFLEALQPEFIEYQTQVIKNAQALALALKNQGAKIITGGTDNHLVLVDVKNTYQLTGKQAADILDTLRITCNKNAIPFDTEKPYYTSGIRLGTPAMTTAGFKEIEFQAIAKIIHRALKQPQDQVLLTKLGDEVQALMSKFQIHGKEE